MLKNPYDALNEFGKHQIEWSRKTNEFIYTQSDSLITWLVGFAFAALSLIVSNISSIETNLKSTAKPIVICLFLTIIIGLAFRYVSYRKMILDKKLDFYFYPIFAEWSMTPIEVDNDIETADYDYITKKLKTDFNEEIPYPRPLSEEEKQIELPKLIAHYKEWCNYSRKQFEIGLNHWAEINQTAYKIDKQITINNVKRGIVNPKIGYDLVKWDKAIGWFYLLCILSFVATVFIVSIYLLC